MLLEGCQPRRLTARPLEGISPMLDPTTGRPASVPDAPERAADAPEATNGQHNPELFGPAASGVSPTVVPPRPKIGDSRPAPPLSKDEAVPAPAGNGRRGQSPSSGQRAEPPRAEDGDGAGAVSGTGTQGGGSSRRRRGGRGRSRGAGGGTGSATASTEANGAGTDGSGRDAGTSPARYDHPSGAPEQGFRGRTASPCVHGSGSRHVRPAGRSRRAGRLGRRRGATAGSRPTWPAGRSLPHVRAHRA